MASIHPLFMPHLFFRRLYRRSIPGNRRSILVGGILMAIAQFLMFFSASAYGDQSSSIPIMYASLGFLILGNGFFKPNISSMVGTFVSQG